MEQQAQMQRCLVTRRKLSAPKTTIAQWLNNLNHIHIHIHIFV